MTLQPYPAGLVEWYIIIIITNHQLQLCDTRIYHFHTYVNYMIHHGIHVYM